MAALVGTWSNSDDKVRAWLRLKVPQLTTEMMKFLGENKQWKFLLKYVVMPNEESVEESVKFSYKATMLLAGDGVEHGDSFIPSFRDVDEEFVEMVVDGYSNSYSVCIQHLCLIVRRLLQKKAGGFNIGLLDLLSDNDGRLVKLLLSIKLNLYNHYGLILNF